MRCLLAIVAACALACGRTSAPILEIATTTSVQNSGLLAALLPAYPDARVRVHAAGSGRALEMLARGDVALVISHAPDTEARYLADRPDWRHHKLAYNHFIIVGPRDDPARVAAASNAAEAFRRIAAGAVFVSRGDQSGTHERELSLWRQAGLTPPSDRLLISGRGMALALRHADEKLAYTLSDEATFWQLQPQLSLIELFRDTRLLNTYAVVYPRDRDDAARFANWLRQGDGRTIIVGYRIAGRPAFMPWPDSP
jgi:tungstate transport system substrate-binding protein